MTRRIALSLILALVAVTGCDSLPGAFAPEGAEWLGELQVFNSGSRRITAVDAQCTNRTRTIRRTLNLGPGQSWTGKYPEDECFISFEFNTGGGWTAGVTFVAGSPQSLSPW